MDIGEKQCSSQKTTFPNAKLFLFFSFPFPFFLSVESLAKRLSYSSMPLSTQSRCWETAGHELSS